MASCCDSNNEHKASADSKTSPKSHLTGSSRFSLISPVASALLHSSCCWLPVSYPCFIFSILLDQPYSFCIDANTTSFEIIKTLLDFFSLGSASASQLQSLRPVFFWITLLILTESIRRNGLDRRTLYRIAISGFLLALPRLSNFAKQHKSPGTPHHSCH